MTTSNPKQHILPPKEVVERIELTYYLGRTPQTKREPISYEQAEQVLPPDGSIVYLYGVTRSDDFTIIPTNKGKVMKAATLTLKNPDNYSFNRLSQLSVYLKGQTEPLVYMTEYRNPNNLDKKLIHEDYIEFWSDREDAELRFKQRKNTEVFFLCLGRA